MDDFGSYVAQTSPYPLGFQVKSAKGIKITDLDGKEFYDLHSGIGVNNLGHGDPLVKGFVKTQVDQYMHTMVYGEHVQDQQVQYAKSLALHFNRMSQSECLDPNDVEDKQVFFVNSGNEAVDLALKLARKNTGRKKLVALEKSFHGRGYGALQVTWNSDYKEGFFIDDSETIFLNPFAIDPDEELKKVDWDDTAAVIVEYVQGEAGAIEIPVSFLEAVRKWCSEHGTFMIADEVQTGYGRLGDFTAQDLTGVIADVTCLGKAGGGGLPFGAVVANRKQFEKLQTPPLSHLSTFGGNPVVCAAGLAVFLQMNTRLYESVREVSKALEEGVQELSQQFPDIIQGLSGVGMMRGLVLDEEVSVDDFYWKCVEQGVLLHFKLNAGSTLRVSPPLTMSLEDVKEVLDRLFEVCMTMPRSDK